jgi:Tfp pilus assembly protein PilF
MSGNAKFRWFLLAPIVVALLVVVTFSVSWAGTLEGAKEQVRQNPNNALAHTRLGVAYFELGQHQNAVASYKEAIRINPEEALTHFSD